MGNLCFLCLFFVVAPAPGAQSTGGSSIAEAQKLLDAGQFQESLKLLDTLAQQQPEPAGVERVRGMVYYQQGQLESSATAFEHAVAQDPSDREAMQMEGVALFRSGKPAAAIPLLERSPAPISTAITSWACVTWTRGATMMRAKRLLPNTVFRQTLLRLTCLRPG
jgi:predicted Zn-dependent protease